MLWILLEIAKILAVKLINNLYNKRIGRTKPCFLINRFSIKNHQESCSGSKSCEWKDYAVFLVTAHKKNSSKNQERNLHLELSQIYFALG